MKNRSLTGKAKLRFFKSQFYAGGSTGSQLRLPSARLERSGVSHGR